MTFLLRKSLAVLAGSLLIALGINMFLVPQNLLDGGMIGIALIINYVFDFKIGLTMIILSMPIYSIAWIYYRSYFFNSIHGLLISSFIIDLMFPLRNIYQFDILSSAVIGGSLVGSGIGIMLRYNTSTGGTDLLAQFISELSKINVGIVIFIIDALVVSIGGFILKAETLVYSLITIISVGVTTSLCTWTGSRG